MLTKQFTHSRARHNYNDLWNRHAAKWNENFGTSRTAAKWQTYISAWMQRIKKKASELKAHCTGTGGGPFRTSNITDVERRLLSLKGMSCLDGDGHTREVGFSEDEENHTLPKMRGHARSLQNSRHPTPSRNQSQIEHRNRKFSRSRSSSMTPPPARLSSMRDCISPPPECESSAKESHINNYATNNIGQSSHRKYHSLQIDLTSDRSEEDTMSRSNAAETKKRSSANHQVKKTIVTSSEKRNRTLSPFRFSRQTRSSPNSEHDQEDFGDNAAKSWTKKKKSYTAYSSDLISDENVPIQLNKKVQRLSFPAQAPKTIVTSSGKRNRSRSPLGQIQSSSRSGHDDEYSEGNAEKSWMKKNKSPFTVDSPIQLSDENVSTQPGKKVQRVLFPAQSQKRMATASDKRNRTRSPLRLSRPIQSSPGSEHDHEDAGDNAEISWTKKKQSRYTVYSPVLFNDENVRMQPGKNVQRLPSPTQSPKTIVTSFEKRNGSLSPQGLSQQIQSSPRSEHNREDSEGRAENKFPFTVDSAIQLGDENVSTQPGKKVQCVLFPAQSQKTASFIHYQFEDFGDDDFPESCGSNIFKYTTASHKAVQYGGSRSLKAVGNETRTVHRPLARNKLNTEAKIEYAGTIINEGTQTDVVRTVEVATQTDSHVCPTESTFAQEAVSHLRAISDNIFYLTTNTAENFAAIVNLLTLQQLNQQE